MNTWIIGDTHFNHKMLVDNDYRPEGFEKLILNNISRVINDNDMLIHLGDFCIGNDVSWHKAFNDVLNLKKNIKRILIKGNHDHRSNTWYYTHGWNFVCDQFEDKYFGVNCKFSHKPLIEISEGYINICGHTHCNNHRDINLTDRHIVFWFEETNYKPVNIKALLRK